MPVEPPAESSYGFVVCRVIRRSADSGQDADEYPDTSGVEGFITFTPHVRGVKVDSSLRYEIRDPITAPLNIYGELTSRRNPSLLGVWLLVGTYDVRFQLATGSIRGFSIEVTNAHTPEAPLDLVTVG